MLSVLIIRKVNKDAKRALKKKTHSDLVPNLTKNNTCNVYFFKVRRHNEGFLFVCAFSLKDKKNMTSIFSTLRFSASPANQITDELCRRRV